MKHNYGKEYWKERKVEEILQHRAGGRREVD
jgi:hypothetical protein